MSNLNNIYSDIDYVLDSNDMIRKYIAALEKKYFIDFKVIDRYLNIVEKNMKKIENNLENLEDSLEAINKIVEGEMKNGNK